MIGFSSETPIRHIQLLLLSYAAAVLAGSAWFAYNTDLAHPYIMGRGLLRVLGMCVLALYLSTQKKAAWWFSIVVTCVLSVVGVAGIVIFGYTSWAYDARHLSTMIVLIVPTVTLVQTLVLLRRPSTQSLFA